MMVATPGVVTEGAETTTAKELGWGWGPVGVMGVTTGR